MSKVVRGIKKVFKKVVKTVKRVAPVVLAAAAVFFTAGTALLGTAGWGAVAGKVGSLIGTGTLGKVVSSAVTQAGYGAAVGGIASELTGGSFTRGAQRGAAIGAVAGGLLGPSMSATAANNPANAGTWRGLMGPRLSGSQTGVAGSPVTPPAAPAQKGLMTNAQRYAQATQNPPPGVAPTAPAVTAPTAAAPTAGLSKLLESPVLGHTLSGIGQGLMAARPGEETAMQYERVGQNYAGTQPAPGLLGARGDLSDPNGRWEEPPRFGLGDWRDPWASRRRPARFGLGLGFGA